MGAFGVRYIQHIGSSYWTPATYHRFLSASLQGGYHIDPSAQAKAICNDDMSVTVLQQQLAEMKNRTSGLESLIASGMQHGASPSFPAAHHAANTTGTHKNRILVVS